ncbi:MAG: 23S rRNA (pseudouridine(1915)-N(3))-methyltransferase RlmH [Chitinivibrionales bacterium]|nr:23S rRNA (pseudouridine(1915)-N(3))-methyltransferase RlmH [Chitinivibrionales bacterium]
MGATIYIIGCSQKNNLYTDLLDRYVQLVKPYAQLMIKLCRPVEGNYRHREEIIAQEEKTLIVQWPAASRRVALSAEGKQMDSIEFAAAIAKLIQGNKSVAFTIGGAFGLSENVKKQCEFVLSLSRMTMPHQVCYVVLAEQIYRAFTILSGHPYHK